MLFSFDYSLITPRHFCWLLSYWFLLHLDLWQLSQCQDYVIESIKWQPTADGFRLLLPDEPGIRFVAYNVNINRPFRGFEAGQYVGAVHHPIDNVWPYKIKRKLNDDDMIYVWVGVQHGNIIHRNHVDAVRFSDDVRPIYNDNTVTVQSGIDTTIRQPTTRRPPPIRYSTEPANTACQLSITQLAIPGDFCKGDVLFEDHFDTLVSNKWNPEIRIPLAQDDAEFVVYNDTTTIENGILKISAHLYWGNIRRGFIDLAERCTGSNIMNECHSEPKLYYVLPPVVSGRLNTRNNFAFKYGYIELKAKLPIGDWLYPLILLEPHNPEYGSDHYNSGQMRIAFARGNRRLHWHRNSIDGRRLYGGVILTQTADLRHESLANITLKTLHSNDEHFGSRFHIYSMLWTPEQLILSVDGRVYGRIRCDFKSIYNKTIWRKGGSNAPLDQFFYITLGLAAGGHGDFPDDITKPWENTSPKAPIQFWNQRGDWHPTWSQPTLQVDYIKVVAI